MQGLELRRMRMERRKKRVFYAIKAKRPRPRLAFVRSNRYFSAQVIDDREGQTLCAASTSEKSFQSEKKKNKEAARQLGEIIASRAKEKGIAQVVLDRRGNLYHGCIAEFSEAARKAGLIF